MIHARLCEIEGIAARARGDAAAHLAELGLVFDRETDLRLVAAVLTGGTVESYPNLTHGGERLAGRLSLTRAYPEIHFEAYDPLVRQRFSIAHELGHFYLHAGSGALAHHRCSQSRVDAHVVPVAEGVFDPEQEADAFAGAFLLPADKLAADLAQFGSCVAFLAERHIVSEATLRRRLRTREQLRL